MHLISEKIAYLTQVVRNKAALLAAEQVSAKAVKHAPSYPDIKESTAWFCHGKQSVSIF